MIAGVQLKSRGSSPMSEPKSPVLLVPSKHGGEWMGAQRTFQCCCQVHTSSTKHPLSWCRLRMMGEQCRWRHPCWS